MLQIIEKRTCEYIICCQFLRSVKINVKISSLLEPSDAGDMNSSGKANIDENRNHKLSVSWV